MELTLDQALKRGVEAHKAGKAQEADQYYTAILKANPKHPDANHNMGVLAVGVGKVEKALPFFKTALEINPNIAQFWLSYIDALIKLDQMDEAKVVFEKAKSNGTKADGFDQLEKRLANSTKIKGDQTDKEILKKAVDFRENGKYDEAIELLKSEAHKYPDDPNIPALLSHCYILNDNLEQTKVYLDAAKNINPNIASIGWNETRLLLKQKKLDEALVVAQRTNKLFPDDVEGMGVFGSCLRANGKIFESLDILNKAIELKPNYAEALVNRGLLSLAQKDKVTALSDLEKAHTLKPHIKQIWDLLIGLKVEAKDYTSAVKILINMIEIDPNYERSFSLLIACNQKADNPTLAQISFQKILDVRPHDATAHVNLGQALRLQGKNNQAIDHFKKALAIKPKYAEAYNNIGLSLRDQGKLQKARDAYKTALSIKPDYPEAINNMGNALMKQGRLEEALAAYQNAINIKPDNAEAFNNMGNALMEQGKLEEASEAYNKALSIKPNNAEAFNNMGNVRKEQGRIEDALESYQNAIKNDPNSTDAYVNFGKVLKEQDKLDEAIKYYNTALTIRPDCAEAKIHLGIALKGKIFEKPNPSLLNRITSLLDNETYVRPRDISSSAISLLQFEPAIKNLAQKYSRGELKQSLKETVSELSKLPLLLKLMSVCPIDNLELEAALTKVRSELLQAISKISDNSDIMRFQSALALQCFTNEYIYEQDEIEAQALYQLDISVKRSLTDGKQPSPMSIMCLASYKALYNYAWSGLLKSNNFIHEVLVRQLKEPESEKIIKQNIATLTEITDKVSVKVQDQYEESPYPRWVNLLLPLSPAPINKVVSHLKLRLSDDNIRHLEQPNILVAGCGTGMHSLGTAARFKNSKVLAIDISLSSLAYAQRRTKELGIKNIDYMHADILDLGKLNRKFDIIESGGVLHHMGDPMAGWKVLTECLKRGGLMKIGLYSDFARQDIVKIRKEIAQLGIGTSISEMKSFRKIMINSNKEHHKVDRSSPDFYTISTLRDLLFHVQEYRFTLPEIAKCLDQLGLKFCGFETLDAVQKFSLTYTLEDDPYDLKKWQLYEENNPRIFANMYQFWCQKVG